MSSPFDRIPTKETPIPWEARLNRFPTIMSGNEKINYWVQQGDKILIGYHGTQETYREREIATLIEPEFGEGRVLFIGAEVQNKGILDKVLPMILEKLGKNTELIMGEKTPDTTTNN